MNNDEVLRSESEFGPQNDNEKQTTRNVKSYFPVQRLKMSAAFVPPKPKELESA